MRVALLIPLTFAVVGTVSVASSARTTAQWRPSRMVHEREVRFAPPAAFEAAAPEFVADAATKSAVRRRCGFFLSDSAVSRIAVSPDGRYVASDHHDDIVRLWDAETGRQIGRTVHINTASLTWSRDSGMLAIAGGVRIRVWNVAAGTRPVMLTRPYPHTEKKVVFGPYGNRISNDENIWDLHTGRLVSAPEPAIEEEILPADHSEVDTDEAFEETEGEDGLSDAPFTGPTTNAPIGLGGSSADCVVAPGGGWRVAIRWRKMTIESTATGHTLATLDGHGSDVAISADSRFIYSLHIKNEVRIWDGWTGAARGKIDVPSQPTCLTASDRYLWVGCDDGVIRRFRAP